MSTHTVTLSHIIDAYIAALWRYKMRTQHDPPSRPDALTTELCDTLERMVQREFEVGQMRQVRARHERTTEA